MTTEEQHTIGQAVSVEGIGLHTGQRVKTVLMPAAPDTGLAFRRMDVEGSPIIPGTVHEVTGVEWETVLGSEPVVVRTVEHLLAAAAAAQIDNLEIQLEGPEPPALDGSSLGWCRLFLDAGKTCQAADAPSLKIEEPLYVSSASSHYAALPYDGYRISAEIDFAHPTIGKQFVSVEVAEQPFYDEVAPARTFGLEDWREELQERGLALGASHENTIVVTDDGLTSETELRFPDEFVRHKVIDLIGDLALVGARLEAHIVAHRPGHRGNIALARRFEQLRNGTAEKTVLDIQKILEFIPHRYPFLLVDRIIEFEAGKRIVGLKNVTINEPFFTGHFPDHPIMPGVLIVEAMAQVGGLLLMNEFDDPQRKVVYFMSLDDVKFRKPVTPGDQLVFELEMLQLRGRTCRMRGVGKVDGQPVAQATMMAMVRDR